MNYEQVYSAKKWGIQCLVIGWVWLVIFMVIAGISLYLGWRDPIFSINYIVSVCAFITFMAIVILGVTASMYLFRQGRIALHADKDWRAYVNAGILDYQTPDEGIAPSFRLSLEEITSVRQEVWKRSEHWRITWFLCLKNGNEIEIRESETPLNIKKLKDALVKSGYPIKYSEVEK
jgi:hypothetical protein